MIDADQGGHGVPHGVHGVVALVAMQGPVAFLVGHKLQLAHLADRHVHRHLGAACGQRPGTAIAAGDLELMPVQVDRVVGHGQVAHPQPHPVAQAHVERVDTRKGPAVPGPEVELEHGVDLGGAGTRLDVVGIEQKAEVAVYLADQRVGCFRVGDPEAHHAHGHLRHFVRMGVVHEGARTARHKLIDKGLADRDLRLCHAAHAVHAVGQALAVPVDGGVLGQLVGDKHPHPVALDHLDRRPRALPVVAPQGGLHAGGDLAHHRLSHQVELLHAILHAPGRGPAVERDHRPVRPARGGGQWRCRDGAAHDDRLGQGRQRPPADAGHGHCCRGDSGAGKKMSSLHCAVHRQRSKVNGPVGHWRPAPGQRLLLKNQCPGPLLRLAGRYGPARNRVGPAGRRSHCGCGRQRWPAGPRC